MSRWIRVSTSIFDHDVFSEEAFTEREAWMWLIAKAAWKETRHRVGGAMVVVPVGSLFVTLRELQTTWKWASDFRVRTFLKLLQSEEMITTDANAGKTQISICNYSRYQNPHHEENASGTHEKRTENAIKTPVHQYTTSSLRSEERASARSPADFDAFWSIYPNKVGKRDAEKSFLKALRRADLETIIAGLRRYAAKTDDRPWCNPSTWLNQDRWEDAPADAPQGRAPGPPRKPNAFDAYDEIAKLKGWTDEPAIVPGNHEDAERVRQRVVGQSPGTVVDLRRGHDWHS